MMTELPVLDEARCTACGDCVVLCPPGCLEAGWPMPWLPRPRECIACSLCVIICPADALSMMPVERDEEDEDGKDD